jgi:heme-degrading monooxygenase HmoA
VVVLGVAYDVLPGREAVFEAAFRRVAATLAADGGHLRTRLYRDVERPCSYLIYSEWADRGALQRFLRSEAFAAVTRWGQAEILAGPPRHYVLDADRGDPAWAGG